MLDFIFVTGASGIGKSTLCQALRKWYRSTCIEQYMVPEFETRDGKEEMTGLLEEKTCWENVKAMAFCFHKLGYRNIILSDLDDLRTRDIPIDFKGTRFVILKLLCSDPEQLKRQMQNRGSGLIDYELQKKSSEKQRNRPLLVNEYPLDVTAKTPEQVLADAVVCLEMAQPLLEYEYTPPDSSYFYSWVFANGLR